MCGERSRYAAVVCCTLCVHAGGSCEHEHELRLARHLSVLHWPALALRTDGRQPWSIGGRICGNEATQRARSAQSRLLDGLRCTREWSSHREVRILLSEEPLISAHGCQCGDARVLGCLPVKRAVDNNAASDAMMRPGDSVGRGCGSTLYGLKCGDIGFVLLRRCDVYSGRSAD